jgi:hypothetical protein
MFCSDFDTVHDMYGTREVIKKLFHISGRTINFEGDLRSRAVKES